MAEHLGSFEQAVLLSILRLHDGAYGRAILKEVEIGLGRDVAPGATHATLDRLEKKGLITSRIGPGTEVRAGRPRRYYRLAPSGRRALHRAHAAVQNLWRDFTLFPKGTS